ncbi:GMC family oxidoreductase [Rhizobium sp. S96]|uniref:GMC oxidoreductase n=1 Tax=Rhizobium sp. S96 TaxID=3055140 RepID=UPI0025AAEB2E|nr:GMC family oxidoreductase [Rhizobium sp. S96]MDM9622225.1 GMC family oxidoreductase [Rhizobium sp. S96]
MCDLSSERWDVAIVGAGMGGSALAYSLALSGFSVLIIEKGEAELDKDASDDESFDPETRMLAGLWPHPVEATVDASNVRFFPALGCGPGGSTILYGGTLERFQRDDFRRADDRGNPTPSWPISYDDLTPFYRLAEECLKARGGRDPLQSDAEELQNTVSLNATDRHFFASLRSNGMNPYELRTAGDSDSRGGKMNAYDAFLDPAIRSGGVHLLARCVAKRIGAGPNEVTGLLCQQDGREFEVKATIYVLAAGALSTPVLMLGSASPLWPNGIANSSGLVGRNLMFHISDFIAVWPRRGGRVSSPAKSIGFRDFYWHQGEKLGQIQSTGLTAGRSNILQYLKERFDTGRLRLPRSLRPLLHIPAFLGSLFFGRATIFASIMEDRPYWENQVLPGSPTTGEIRFRYTSRDELKGRIARFRKLYRRAFSGHRMFLLSTGQNLNYGHACGTCRFGDNPESSVLNANNQAHDLANLFVVDGSFFPSSGGTNPSLTIAANALRVGQYIAQRLSTVGINEDLDVDRSAMPATVQ